MSAVIDLLNDAKALLAKGVSTGGNARDKDDNVVDPFDESAETFSIYGALQRAAHDRRSQEGFDHALVLLGADQIQDPYMTGAGKRAKGSDNEQDHIGALFDKAIARADGGPVPGISVDAERRALDPNADDYHDKLREIDQRAADPNAVTTSSEPQSSSEQLPPAGKK
jgi:hypothetical protein